jgi:hypothetical protein
VRFAISQAKRQYKEALIPDPAKFGFDEADPPAAFAALLAKLGIKTIIGEDMRALEDNIEWIDVAAREIDCWECG